MKTDGLEVKETEKSLTVSKNCFTTLYCSLFLLGTIVYNSGIRNSHTKVINKRQNHFLYKYCGRYLFKNNFFSYSFVALVLKYKKKMRTLKFKIFVTTVY